MVHDFRLGFSRAAAVAFPVVDGWFGEAICGTRFVKEPTDTTDGTMAKQSESHGPIEPVISRADIGDVAEILRLQKISER